MKMQQLHNSIEYLKDAIDALLDEVDYNDATGPLIDEIVGVALPNLELAADELDD